MADTPGAILLRVEMETARMHQVLLTDRGAMASLEQQIRSERDQLDRCRIEYHTVLQKQLDMQSCIVQAEQELQALTKKRESLSVQLEAIYSSVAAQKQAEANLFESLQQQRRDFVEQMDQLCDRTEGRQRGNDARQPPPRMAEPRPDHVDHDAIGLLQSEIESAKLKITALNTEIDSLKQQEKKVDDHDERRQNPRSGYEEVDQFLGSDGLGRLKCIDLRQMSEQIEGLQCDQCGLVPEFDGAAFSDYLYAAAMQLESMMDGTEKIPDDDLSRIVEYALCEPTSVDNPEPDNGSS